MYRWCAYCQHYLGEKAPFDDYSLTHGICPACVSLGSLSDEEAMARTAPIAQFHADLVRFARSGQLALVSTLVRRGLALGMRPVDLLVGILQPVLYEVGRLWEVGELTPHQEHLFTSFCDAVLEDLTLEQCRLSPPVSRPPVLLVNAQGNQHTIGLRMAAFTLREGGLNAQALVPTPALDDLAEMIVRARPSVIGVSLALPSQLRYLHSLLDRLASIEPRPRVIAGGYAVRAGLALPKGVEAWGQIEDLLDAGG